MKKPNRTTTPRVRILNGAELAVATGGALNAYLYLKGAKSGELKDPPPPPPPPPPQP